MSFDRNSNTPFEEEGVYRSHCVWLSVCLSVGSHILSGLFLTNHWVEFNNILHEASIPRGDVHILKGLQLRFTELWPFYLLSYGVDQGAV